jgi:hypothetical protein
MKLQDVSIFNIIG